MLRIVRSMAELHFSQLMEVYMEGNQENARERYPHLPEGQGLLQSEQDFYQYLRHDFFTVPGAYYAIWHDGGVYVSALRIEPYKDGVLLEALETAPEKRRRGYGEKLMRSVLPLEGKIYSHVSKRNLPSLNIHEKCGFVRISEQAAFIDGSINSKCCTLCYENIGE